MNPDELPHVIGGNRLGILIPQGNEYYENKHRRRGRLSEWVATQIARGKEIPDEWWSQHSGEKEDDRVEHEELREDAEAIRKVLGATGMKLIHYQLALHHPVLKYQAHLDWVVSWLERERVWVIDLKRGEPQDWHALQLALYRDAYLDQFRGHIPNAANIYLPSGKIVERNDYKDLLDARCLAKSWWIKHNRGLL